jgi:hypothetical protein
MDLFKYTSITDFHIEYLYYGIKKCNNCVYMNSINFEGNKHRHCTVCGNSLQCLTGESEIKTGNNIKCKIGVNGYNLVMVFETKEDKEKKDKEKLNKEKRELDFYKKDKKLYFKNLLLKFARNKRRVNMLLVYNEWRQPKMVMMKENKCNQEHTTYMKMKTRLSCKRIHLMGPRYDIFLKKRKDNIKDRTDFIKILKDKNLINMWKYSIKMVILKNKKNKYIIDMWKYSIKMVIFENKRNKIRINRMKENYDKEQNKEYKCNKFLSIEHDENVKSKYMKMIKDEMWIKKLTNMKTRVSYKRLKKIKDNVENRINFIKILKDKNLINMWKYSIKMVILENKKNKYIIDMWKYAIKMVIFENKRNKFRINMWKHAVNMTIFQNRKKRYCRGIIEIDEKYFYNGKRVYFLIKQPGGILHDYIKVVPIEKRVKNIKVEIVDE